MQSMLEKLGLALLITLWLVYGGNTLGNMLVHADEGDIESLRIVTEADDEAGDTTEMASAEPTAMGVLDLLASADAAAGEKVFKKCKACHSLEDGAKHKVGPNLWGVVGRNQGGAAGFGYSDAISSLGGAWSFDSLDEFLADPKGFAPGNKMSFKGVKKPEARAALILYLNAQSSSPVSLP